MLPRRNLRTKVMQALYITGQDKEASISTIEKNMINNVKSFITLYQHALYLVVQLAEFSKTKAEKSSNNPDITQTEFYKVIINDKELAKAFKAFEKISYDIKMLSTAYNDIIHSKAPKLVKAVISVLKNNELIQQFLEEYYVNWSDDMDLVLTNIDKLNGKPGKDNPIFSTDLKEEQAFCKQLFKQTLQNNEYLVSLVEPKTKNWEIDRIAIMDLILIKMALAEMLYFPDIPVKVSMNEYIDISKRYSTPKSKEFINGVLDILLKELKDRGEITKSGRGLIE